MSDYDRMKDLMEGAIVDLTVLSGDAMGTSGVSWQDVAGTAVVNLRALANLIEKARSGEQSGPVVFPSPIDVFDEHYR